MDPRVAEIARAVFPEKVPVIVKVVLVECARRRRTQPQVVVHAGRHRAVRDDANRIPASIDHRPARVNGA